eukprot:GHRQ01040110.1.p3 GENE.GHRQ01040110.1~~GHRQ01040110.1.p3  ORF type:complete len:114 (+),score=23.42 GHRQ01040110.1:135-476(+)
MGTQRWPRACICFANSRIFKAGYLSAAQQQQRRQRQQRQQYRCEHMLQLLCTIKHIKVSVCFCSGQGGRRHIAAATRIQCVTQQTFFLATVRTRIQSTQAKGSAKGCLQALVA